ncbi:MAG: redox-sensing transcriptional repressor Rex [Ruminococcaceae bacterium]|nr:redox-sensing transcriptional repressor Rex [Oscillospiraceae bacterium]
MQKKDKKVPEVVIRRLPRYYRYLKELNKNGKMRISSGALSKEMGVTASQIRQDFSYFGGFGQQGYGYNIQYVTEEIENLFGVTKGHSAVIIGAGNLGRALANYQGIKNRGVTISAMFDISPEKIGKDVSGIPVMPMDKMEDFVRENKTDIAILTLPKDNVTSVAERLKNCGIKGFWNFTSVELEMPEPVMIENVHLTDSLMTLAYKISTDLD